MTTNLTDNADHWVGLFDVDDVVNGGGGNDTMVGGLGDDTLHGDDGNDTLVGDRGADKLFGGAGDDVLWSNADKDFQTEIDDVSDAGLDDAGTLDGGAGDDIIIVSHDFAGTMKIRGGDGHDVLYFDGDSAGFIHQPAGLVNTADLELDNGTTPFGGLLDVTGIEDIVGGIFDDRLSGDGDVNFLTGLKGDDILNGRGGDDHLFGNDGEDSLVGGEGNDFLYGGTDNDALSGGQGDDTLNGGSGVDAMFGGAGNDIYYVDNAGDAVSEFLGSGDDTVYATVTFTLPAAVEDLVLQGSAAIDGTGNASDNLIAGNDQANIIRGLDGDDILKGGGGADRLDGGADNDTLLGGQGDDRLNGGLGDDHMEGGADDDTYSVDSPGDEVVEAANAGIDTVNAGGGLGHYTLTANVENLTLTSALDGTGNNLGNVITGNLFDNVLEGLGGSDTLIGGFGTDTATYEHNGGRVIVTLLDGADGSAVEFATSSARAPDSTDTLRSIENVTGSAFNDQVTGNSLDNVLDGRGGADVMAGLNGNDTYIVDRAADIVNEAAGQGTADRVQTSVSYTLAAGSEVEFLETTNASGTAAINLTGNGFGNMINGNDGNNVINGGVNTNAANFDTMAGHGGNDTYIVDANADVAVEAIGEGTLDRVQTSATYVLRAGSEVEVLETTNQAATTALDLVGNEFGNIIIGNNGQNTLVGGFGLDTLVGGGGGDIFVWSSVAETGVAANEADIVGADFDPLIGDKLAFNPIDANELVGGDQAFTFIGQGPFTGAGQISTFTDGFDTYILLNTDGDAVQEATIRVLGVHSVDASWFVL